MIKVLGRKTSINVQTVLWALSELGLEYDRSDIGGAFGGNDTPEYLSMNPNGLVPVLLDGDFTMFESAAIVRYLAAQYGDDLFYPKDSKVRARLDMWAEWAKGTFYPALIPRLFYMLVRDDPKTLDQSTLKTTCDQIAELAQMLDKRLGEGPFINGDHLTFADIIIGALLYRYDTLEFEKTHAPNLDDYYDRLKARDAYQENIMVSYESLRWKPD